MREATALEGGMTDAELDAYVTNLRRQQGLGPRVENATALDRIATLLRAANTTGSP